MTDSLEDEIRKWKQRQKKQAYRDKKALETKAKEKSDGWKPVSIRITIDDPAAWREMNGASPKQSLVDITEHHIFRQLRQHRKDRAHQAWADIGSNPEYAPYEYNGPSLSGTRANKMTDEQIDLAVDTRLDFSEAEIKLMEDRAKAVKESEDRRLRGGGRVAAKKRQE